MSFLHRESSPPTYDDEETSPIILEDRPLVDYSDSESDDDEVRPPPRRRRAMVIYDDEDLSSYYGMYDLIANLKKLKL